MTEPYVGEIRGVAFGFAPQNWMLCEGQILRLQTNPALFAILGNRYGGDGVRDFALPDLRGRMVMGVGTGPGLTPRSLGETAGQAAVTLEERTMPTHTHLIPAASGVATSTSPVGGVPAALAQGAAYAATGAVDAMSHPVSPAGGTQAHENRQPYLALHYIICTSGAFPPRP